MKKIFVIMQQCIFPNDEVLFGFEDIANAIYVFTSKADAEKQMDQIHRMTESGDWYVNKGHRVEYDEIRVGKRTIKINHPNGTHTLVRLNEVMLNAGYDI